MLETYNKNMKKSLYNQLWRNSLYGKLGESRAYPRKLLEIYAVFNGVVLYNNVTS